MEDTKVKLITEDILSRSSAQPIYLTSIEINGGELFSNNFFKKSISPLIESRDLTFKRLIENIDSSYENLSSIGIFKDIKFLLVEDYSNVLPEIKNYNFKNDNVIKTKVKIDLLLKRLNVGELMIDLSNDIPLNVKLNYLNYNFNANNEILNILVNYNPYKPQYLFTKFELMKHLSSRWSFDMNFQNNKENLSYLNNKENIMGGSFGLNYTLSSTKMLIGLSMFKKKIESVAASDVYFKNSLFFNLDYNQLLFLNGKKNFPVKGFRVDLSNEISSIDNSNPFIDSKQDPELEKAAASNLNANPNLFNKLKLKSDFYYSVLNNHLTFNVSNEFGLIMNPNNLNIYPNDKFYIGGLNSANTISSINSIVKKHDTSFDNFFRINSFIYFKLPKSIHSLSNDQNPLRFYTNFIFNNFNDFNISSVGFGLRYFNDSANFNLGYYFNSVNSFNSFGSVNNGLQFNFSIGGSNKQ